MSVSRDGGLRIEPVQLRRTVTRMQVSGNEDRLFVVQGEGSARVLEVLGEVIAAWMPLRGSVQVHTSGLSLQVQPRSALVTEPETNLRVATFPGSKWLALVGSKVAWRLLMTGVPSPEALPLPAMHAIDWDRRRRIVALARCTHPDELGVALQAFAGEMAALQAPLQQAIARSPGRSFANKLQVFLRLQRVRRFMNANCEQELDNESLARIASFSPCHFLRTFKAVYRETPHAYLVRQRLRRAERLLRSGHLAVTEVALASGFENRSAFSRCYRQHFGVTANEARKDGSRNELQRAAW